MTQRVTAMGLHIPPVLLARLGWREGQDVDIRVDENGITIIPVSDLERTILRRALAYLLERVGDATTVGSIRRHRDGWEVPVVLSYADHELGRLRFSDKGEFLPEASTPPETMTEAAEQAGRL